MLYSKLVLKISKSNYDSVSGHFSPGGLSNIEETDNWPKFICRKCFDTANVCVEFISTIRESESTLKSIYGDLRDLDRKPGIEIVDIRSVPQYEFEVKREVVDEEVPTKRRSLRKVTSPKKRGRPRKHKIPDEGIVKDESDALFLESHSSNLIVKSSPVSDSQPESPFVQNDASEDEKIEEKPGKITRKKLDISEYTRKVEEFFKMDCDICDQSCNTLPNLQNHYRTVHNRKGYVMCCNIKLNRRSKVLQHLELHKNPNAFQCTQWLKNI
uniref:Uncharacterized protein n=1 Tax=Phlebotomus papatasi TaxID=29031 RepID=A0A1B0D6M6_PHLPP